MSSSCGESSSIGSPDEATEIDLVAAEWALLAALVRV
jgi:hypothetical protein